VEQTGRDTGDELCGCGGLMRVTCGVFAERCAVSAVGVVRRYTAASLSTSDADAYCGWRHRVARSETNGGEATD